MNAAADNLAALRPWWPLVPDAGRDDATRWFVVFNVEEAGRCVIGEPLTGPFTTLSRARESLELMRREVPDAYVARHVIEVFPEASTA